MTDTLKTKPKYQLPDSSIVRESGARSFLDNTGRVLFLAFRDVFDDFKLLFKRMTQHQTPAASPAEIAAHKNDYSPGEGAFLRLTSDAARNITGISGGEDGRRLTIVNVGAFTITLKHQDAASVEANRILSQSGADVAVAVNAIKELIYDSTTARWRV